MEPGTPRAERQSFTECFICGVCCRYRVCMMLEDVERISACTGLPIEAFTEWLKENLEDYAGYDDSDYGGLNGEADFLEQRSYMFRHENGRCVFVKNIPGTKKFICSIHPVRPSPCRAFTAGVNRDSCREGLAKLWGLTISSSGELEGSEEKLNEFLTYLQSISC